MLPKTLVTCAKVKCTKEFLFPVELETASPEIQVNCTSVNDLKSKEKFETIKKRHDFIDFEMPNVDIDLKIRRPAKTLEYEFIDDYIELCKHDGFTNTRCGDRFDRFFDDRLDEVMSIFFYMCAREEKLFNCWNFTEDFGELREYKRVVLMTPDRKRRIIDVKNITREIIEQFESSCEAWGADREFYKVGSTSGVFLELLSTVSKSEK